MAEFFRRTLTLMIACLVLLSTASSAHTSICEREWNGRTLVTVATFSSGDEMLRVDSADVDIMISVGSQHRITFDSPADYAGSEYVSAQLIRASGLSLDTPLCIYTKFAGIPLHHIDESSISVTPIDTSPLSQVLASASFSWQAHDLASQKAAATALYDATAELGAPVSRIEQDLFFTALYANYQVSNFDRAQALSNPLSTNSNGRYFAPSRFIQAQIALLDSDADSALNVLQPLASYDQQGRLNANQQVQLALLQSNAYFSNKVLELGESALARANDIISDRLVDPRLQTGIFDNLGHQQLTRFYQGSGQSARDALQLGLDYQYRALAMTAQTGDIAKKISIHGNTAWLHRAAGMYQSALRHYFIALNFSEQYARDINRVYLYRNIASVYLATGATDKAHNYLAKASELSNTLSEFWQTKINCILAQYDEAKDQTRRQCIDRFTRLVEQEPEKQSYLEGLLEAIAEDGIIAYRQAGHDPDSNRVAMIRQLLEQVKSNAIKSKGLHYLMLASFHAGDLGAGRQFYDQAAKLLDQSSLPALKITIIDSLFDEHFKGSPLLQDSEVEDLLLGLIDTGVTFSIDELGWAWSNQVNRLFTQYISSLIAKNQYDHAFEWYSRSRMFGKANASAINASQASHQSYLDSLSQHAAALAAQTPTRENKVTLDIARDLLSLNQWLPSDDPQVMEIARFNQSRMIENVHQRVQHVSLKQVQQTLSSNEVLLAYFMDRERYHAFVITQTSLDVSLLGNIDIVDNLVSTLADKLSDPRQQYRSATRDITQHVLPVTLSFDRVAKLRVLPEGSLHRLPFSILHLPSGQPLVDRVSISTTRFLDSKNQETEPRDSANIVVFAAPDTSSSNNLLTWSSSLPDLPWSEYEAEEILKLFSQRDIQLYTQSQANRNNFMQWQTRNADILHVSTHHFFDPSQPDNVGFTLSTTNEFGGIDPGFVGKEEITHYRFNNDLVVINGCGSALGDHSAGVAMMGVSNAFLSAGVNNVVSTLWPVSDRASATFSVYFYQALKQGKHYDAALREAQSKMKKSPRFRHPFYWAGYTLSTARFSPDFTA